MPYGFEILNRNKQSITVDLSKEGGRKIVYSLVTKADVLVQNFHYGVAKKLCEEVLVDMLGYTWKDVEILRDLEVIL